MCSVFLKQRRSAGRVMKKPENKPVDEKIDIAGLRDCLEIITVRITRQHELEHALGFCSQVFQAVDAPELKNMGIYRSIGYESDLSIHLCRKSDLTLQEKSLLGMRLANGLGEFGIVSHTLWANLENVLK